MRPSQGHGHIHYPSCRWVICLSHPHSLSTTAKLYVITDYSVLPITLYKWNHTICCLLSFGGWVWILSFTRTTWGSSMLFSIPTVRVFWAAVLWMKTRRPHLINPLPSRWTLELFPVSGYYEQHCCEHSRTFTYKWPRLHFSAVSVEGGVAWEGKLLSTASSTFLKAFWKPT